MLLGYSWKCITLINTLVVFLLLIKNSLTTASIVGVHVTMYSRHDNLELERTRSIQKWPTIFTNNRSIKSIPRFLQPLSFFTVLFLLHFHDYKNISTVKNLKCLWITTMYPGANMKLKEMVKESMVQCQKNVCQTSSNVRSEWQPNCTCICVKLSQFSIQI